MAETAPIPTCAHCQSAVLKPYRSLTVADFRREGTAGIAARYGVSRQTAWRWRQQLTGVPPKRIYTKGRRHAQKHV